MRGISDSFNPSLLSSGAFSNVYKARDRKTGLKVAIKVVRKYELNSNQVSNCCIQLFFFFFFHFSFLRVPSSLAGMEVKSSGGTLKRTA
jgi:serine/threonine protein kinase